MKTKVTPFVEELVNSLTHGIGAALSVVATVLLVVYASTEGNVWHVVSFSIFGASLITLYSASTLYHSARKMRLKVKLNRFDHSAIYILIAGTYTPYTLVTLNGWLGWTIFGIIWALAIAGVLYKVFFYSAKYRKISAILYVIMGWIIVMAIKPMIDNMAPGGLWLLLAGGLSYSLGVVFYLWKSLPLSHGIFHLFVLGGSICHFFSILLYVR